MEIQGEPQRTTIAPEESQPCWLQVLTHSRKPGSRRQQESPGFRVEVPAEALEASSPRGRTAKSHRCLSLKSPGQEPWKGDRLFVGWSAEESSVLVSSDFSVLSSESGSLMCFANDSSSLKT